MTPRLRAAAAGAALAVAAAAGARAMDLPGGAGGGPHVSIAFAAFATPRLDVVAGEDVRWTNDSVRAHDVVALDDSFDSGRLPSGYAFAHRFDTLGAVPYYCSIHPFMTGEVDVHSVLLDAPTQRGGSGKPFVLTGRAAAGVTGGIAIEGDDGAGFRRVGTTTAGADGHFRVTVLPRTSTTYRAVAGADPSPPVQLLVLDHAVAIAAGHHGRDTAISVRVTPAAPGAVVVLQLRLRDRFGWWPLRRTRLDAASHARFVVRRGGPVPGRVLLTLPDGATELARSRTVTVG